MLTDVTLTKPPRAAVPVAAAPTQCPTGDRWVSWDSLKVSHITSDYYVFVVALGSV